MNLVDRLRRQVEFLVEVWCGDLENPEHEGLRLYREAADEIERLREIVAKLDKTADDVPVVPHKTAVYHPELADNDGVLDSLYVDACGWAHGVDHRGWEHGADYRNTLFHRRVSECYSTRKAALAAKP